MTGWSKRVRIWTTPKGFLFCFYPEQLGGQIYLMGWGAWGKRRMMAKE